jgi:hypothetical protein
MSCDIIQRFAASQTKLGTFNGKTGSVKEAGTIPASCSIIPNSFRDTLFSEK